MAEDTICQYLDWDSNWFSCRIARLLPCRLTRETAQTALGWCEVQRIDCLYFLADPSDAMTLRLAHGHGFRLVDIRVTLENELQGNDLRRFDLRVRTGRVDDIAALREIAKTSHSDSRFYFDGGFPRPKCDELYEIWIEKSCRGYADCVLVAELGGQAAGYVTCHTAPDHCGQIGLFAVASGARGQGLGRELVQAALLWFKEKGLWRVTVVTQGRNAKAQRTYQKAGFVTKSTELWYHRWFSR